MLGLFIVILIAALVSVFAGAYGQGADDDRDNVVLEGNLTDVQFVAGETVTIKADISDDVFAAGREVVLDGATARNAIVAGYDVEQRSGSVSDFIVAANSIEIGDTVNDDVIAVGRTVRIASGASVGGDVRIAAERVDIEGKVSGSVRAAGRRISIAGEIDGKVDLLAERIVIGPSAVINGDVVYRSGNTPDIAGGATITGEVRQIEIDMPNIRTLIWTLIGIGLLLMLMWAIAGLVVTAAVVGLFPAMVTASSDRLRERTWANLGIGIVVLAIAVVVAGMAFGSIIGIPIGGLLSLLIALLVLFGLVTVSACIGLFIRARIHRGTGALGTGGLIGWTLLGAVLVGLVALIPFAGALVSGLAIAAGAGASSLELWRRLREV